jgi:glycosyltransferase involved in cell wall biosynthesis
MLRLQVTGHKPFLDRHSGLFRALRQHFDHVEVTPSGNLMGLVRYRIARKVAHLAGQEKVLHSYLQTLDRSKSFALSSRQTEKKVKRYGPDHILHIFGQFRPFWRDHTIPYSMYLDYTMALAIKEWPAWAKFSSIRDRQTWLDLETDTYERAEMLFTMGENTKRSLVSDYGIVPSKIRVVGSAGAFDKPFDGAKSLGEQKILFQGSEFERKGGDLVLAAFAEVRKTLPSAELIIIGTDRPIRQAGVTVLGYVSPQAAVEQLFLSSDIVAAPARCDPFPGLVIEGMNYGVPSIVSRQSGIAEALQHGKTSWILEDLSPRSLAEAIVRLLEDPSLWQKLSDGGRAAVAAEFNWNAVASKIADGIMMRRENLALRS